MDFTNAMLFTEDFRFQLGCFSVEEGRFANVLGQERPGAVDLKGAYVIPGLIDIHTHGNSGADFSDGDEEGLRRMMAYYGKSGVTSAAPTSMTRLRTVRGDQHGGPLLLRKAEGGPERRLPEKPGSGGLSAA